jgi:hypothetical protein
LKINWYSPENTMFIVKKPGASKCVILCQECAKTRLRASINSKKFSGVIPRTPVKREGKEGNWEGWGWRDGKGREGMEGRDGKGGWG